MTKAEMFNYTRINAGCLLIQPPRKPAVSATNIGKSIPLQAWTGPEGSRRLRLPDFKTAHESGKVSPAHRPPLPQETFLVLTSSRG